MRDDEPRLMLEETGKHGNLQTYCGGEESLPERWVKGVVGARGADGPEPGEGFPVEGLGVVGLLFPAVHLHSGICEQTQSKHHLEFVRVLPMSALLALSCPLLRPLWTAFPVVRVCDSVDARQLPFNHARRRVVEVELAGSGVLRALPPGS